jgi:hypothetical protein
MMNMEIATDYDSGEGARQFYDGMATKETDSTEVRVAKEVLRWSSAVAGAAAVHRHECR